MKFKNNDIEAIRQLNTVLVLNTLRRSDRLLSRPNMAEILGLSKVTVATIIRELNEQGFTIEAGVGPPDSRGGRKPILVALDSRFKRAMGARLGRDGIDLVITDLKGRPLKRLTYAGSGERNYQMLIPMIKEALTSTNTKTEDVVGLAVAVSCPYSELDCCLEADGTPTVRPPVEARLQDELGLPVKLVSFTRARAFAECWYNQDYGNPQPFFYLNLGPELDGVAARRNVLDQTPCALGCCYLAPRLYEDDRGEPWTLNEALGGRYFAEKTLAAYGRAKTCSELTSLADGGDARARAIFREFGHNLGCAISLVINMSCVNNIVLGGTYVRGWGHFKQSLNESLNLHISDKVRGSIEVRPIKPDYGSGLAGALALALDLWVYQTRVLYNNGN